MRAALSVLDEVRDRAFEPQDDSDLSDWMYRNVLMRGSPIGSRFDIEATPWLREPMEALSDARTREVVISAAAQLGKSVLACGYTAYALAELKQSVIVVLDTQAQSDIFNQTKLFPMVKSCKKILQKMPKESTLKSRIHLESNDLLTGPANNSFLRSHSSPIIVGDEVSKWEAGSIHNARARTRQFPRSRCLFISTPLFKESDFGQAWMAGSQERWAHKCCGCGELFIPKMSTLKWDDKKDRETKARNMPLIKETLRMVCPLCNHKHNQTAGEVKAMNEGGGYLSENPNITDHRIRSFMFSALSLPERLVSWYDLVSEFLSAKDSIATGFDAPLKEFVNLQLGEFWQGSGSYVDTFKIVEKTAEMTGEKYRIMSVDVQRDLTDFWVLIRDWAPDGTSQLVAFENVGEFHAIDELIKKYKVKNHQVMIDCADQSARVVQEAQKRRWMPVRGTPRLYFTHNIKSRNGRMVVRRLYSPLVKMNQISSMTKRVHYCVELASDPLRDLFVNLRDGRSTIKWETSLMALGDYSQQYDAQVKAMARVMKSTTGVNPKSVWTKTGPNHAFDCEVMQVGGALLLKLPFAKAMQIPQNLQKRIRDAKSN